MDSVDAAAVQGKMSLLAGYDADLSAVTFCIVDEDHTLGNVLRYMLMKDIPHPSESKIHMRVQMCEHTVSAVDALRDALSSLDAVFATINDAYSASLSSGHVIKEPAPQPPVSGRPEFGQASK
ncbi:RNA polymerase subunit AC19 [Malassezia sp. CBS 17886]|nr:RNA polymerase subunit AC19 [Malassezia sp. CBS 17886]